MATIQLPHIIIMLSASLLLMISFYGWGRLLALIVKINLPEVPFAFDSIWKGFCAVLFITQIWHIFLPVNFIASALILGTGLFISAVIIVNERKKLRTSIKNVKYLNCLFMLSAFILCCYFLFRAMAVPQIYDSGLYHFNSIRWINEYPLVPGLGNLHSRLGFNQSFFSYVALLNLYPFFNHGYNIANSFFIILLILNCIYNIYCLFHPASESRSMAVSNIFSLFISPIVLYQSIVWSISSPTPDIFIFLVQILLFIHILKLIESKTQNEKHYEFMFIVIIAATAITCKISIIVYSILIVMLALFFLIYSREGINLKMITPVIPYAIFALAIIMVWVYRGIVQTGYPFFPSTVFGMDYEWSVPVSTTRSLANIIYAWARGPAEHWSDVLNNWDWFKPWFYRTFKMGSVYYPCLLFTTGLFVLLYHLIFSKYKSIAQNNLIFYLLFVPLIGSVAFWFITAPDPRFSGSLFWILAALPFALYSSFSHLKRSMVFVTAIFFILPLWTTRLYIVVLPHSKFQALPKPPLIKKTTVQGLDVNTSINTDQLWDSPLPATPYFNKKLKLIGEDLSSGFSVKQNSK